MITSLRFFTRFDGYWALQNFILLMRVQSDTWEAFFCSFTRNKLLVVACIIFGVVKSSFISCLYSVELIYIFVFLILTDVFELYEIIFVSGYRIIWCCIDWVKASSVSSFLKPMELNFILFICRQSTVMIIPLLLNELIFGNIWGTLLSLILSCRYSRLEFVRKSCFVSAGTWTESGGPQSSTHNPLAEP